MYKRTQALQRKTLYIHLHTKSLGLKGPKLWKRRRRVLMSPSPSPASSRQGSHCLAAMKRTARAAPHNQDQNVIPDEPLLAHRGRRGQNSVERQPTKFARRCSCVCQSLVPFHPSCLAGPRLNRSWRGCATGIWVQSVSRSRTHACMHGWMEGWMDGVMGGWMDGSMSGSTDGLMDGWMKRVVLRAGQTSDSTR